jgi:hypothetical protein
VDFWGVKSSGCEKSHATEVIFSNIPQAKFHTEKESKSKPQKIKNDPASILHFPTLLLQYRCR